MLIAASLAGGALFASSATAQAYDELPCGPQWYHGPPVNDSVQWCPDWAPGNWIPVYENTDQSLPVVGHIYAPGNDWYQCQIWDRNHASTIPGYNYYNHHWAYTMADNGRRGWVGEVYFSGGKNDEADRGLRFCD